MFSNETIEVEQWKACISFPRKGNHYFKKKTEENSVNTYSNKIANVLIVFRVWRQVDPSILSERMETASSSIFQCFEVSITSLPLYDNANAFQNAFARDMLSLLIYIKLPGILSWYRKLEPR